MKNFNAALLQILPGDSLEGNLSKGLDYCRRAKQMGAEIAVFPEMWSIGYNLGGDNKKTEALAISANGDFINRFRELARELDMAVCVTYLEKFDPSPRNSLVVIDRHGNIILRYAKVHTCVFDEEERRLTPGDDFYTAALDTHDGPVTIGAMICYDREFPESARVLMLKGAEIIFAPNACPMEINRLSQLRARAFENMVGIATVNYPCGKPDCNGHSSAFDGIAYRPGYSGSRDTLIVEAGEAEGIYMASFPMEELRDYRKREVHGAAYRRPEKYRLLTQNKKEPQFFKYARVQGRETAYMTGMPVGIFAAVHRLQVAGLLTEEEKAVYHEIDQVWFQENLPNPPFYDDDKPGKPITWFKTETAGFMLEKVRPLMEMLEKYSKPYDLVYSNFPGRIVYEDEWQVAVYADGARL